MKANPEEIFDVHSVHTSGDVEIKESADPVPIQPVDPVSFETSAEIPPELLELPEEVREFVKMLGW